VLLIDPDPVRGMEIYAALRDLKAESELVSDAEQGWRRFAASRPDVVLASFAPQGRGGDVFLRRLRDEYMGVLPATYLLCAPEELAAAAALEPDAFLVPPIARAALAAIAGGTAGPRETEVRAATRFREMFDLTLLGGDVIRGLDTLVSRVALAFQVPDCAAWGSGGDDDTWPRTAAELPPDQRAWVFDRARVASQAAGTVLFGAPGKGAVTDAPGHSVMALPLTSGDLVLGGMAVLGDGARIFSPAERDTLVLLARRTSSEMAWVAAHGRLLSENERLREAALVDGLTGVWNRSALEQAVAAQIQVAHRTPQALSLMVIDIVRLSAINDRHGHVIGDAVLAHLAGLIAANLRANDVIGRVAGDEFGVLLVGCDAENARNAAEHLRAAVARSPYRNEHLSVEFAIRFGIAQVRADELIAAPALTRAEAGLSRARRRSTEVALDITDSMPEPRSGNADSIPPGATVGGMYKVLHEISRGAMGVVYRGEDLGLGRQVALKVLRADLASDEMLVQRFRQEAALLASLHHPHLVQVYTLGTERDLVYFVMELVEGESVADVMARHEFGGTPIELSAVSKVVDEIGAALDAIHALGIVHRDVKPDNILIDRVHDRAVLVDVGVAKRQDGAREAAGTPGYAAPESFMDRDPTPTIDVYGLAATAYAMLTGLPPYGAGELLPVFERQLHERPAPASQLRTGLGSAVDEVLSRALAPDPIARYRAASAFSFALGRALEQAVESSINPPSAVATLPRAHVPGDRLAPVPDRDDDMAHTQRYLGVRIDARGVAHGPFELRGLFFRTGYQVFGRLHGTAWVVALTGENEKLAALVAPTTSVASWHLGNTLLPLVSFRTQHEAEALEAARMLGEAVLSAGFGHLIGGVGEAAVDPRTLMASAGELFARYFRGSKLMVDELTDKSCRLSLEPGSGHRVLCALVEGWLLRLAELTGGRQAAIEHPEHTKDGTGACRFRMRWS
jgi:diguanylate cyclase (GGDEF)-like protein